MTVRNQPQSQRNATRTCIDNTLKCMWVEYLVILYKPSHCIKHELLALMNQTTNGIRIMAEQRFQST
jgi:hypothetical protein